MQDFDFNVNIEFQNFHLSLRTSSSDEIVQVLLIPENILLKKKMVDQNIHKVIKHDLFWWKTQGDDSYFLWAETFRQAYWQLMLGDGIRKFSSDQICACLGVTRSEIEKLHHEGFNAIEDLTVKTQIATRCRSCVNDIKKILKINRPEYYQNKSRADWIFVLDSWLKSISHDLNQDLSLEDFHQGQLRIVSRKKLDNSKELSQFLESQLKDKFQFDFFVFLINDSQS